MLLGSKPLKDMSEEEMDAAIAELRDSREALRAEAIARGRVERAPKAPRAPREAKPVDSAVADILKELMSNDDS